MFRSVRYVGPRTNSVNVKSVDYNLMLHTTSTSVVVSYEIYRNVYDLSLHQTSHFQLQTFAEYCSQLRAK